MPTERTRLKDKEIIAWMFKVTEFKKMLKKLVAEYAIRKSEEIDVVLIIEGAEEWLSEDEFPVDSLDEPKEVVEALVLATGITTMLSRGVLALFEETKKLSLEATEWAGANKVLAATVEYANDQIDSVSLSLDAAQNKNAELQNQVDELRAALEKTNEALAKQIEIDYSIVA